MLIGHPQVAKHVHTKHNILPRNTCFCPESAYFMSLGSGATIGSVTVLCAGSHVAAGLGSPSAQALDPCSRMMAGWSLVWEWGWRCLPQLGRWRNTVHFSPAPTPQIRRNCPWDHPLERVLSTARSGWRGKIERVIRVMTQGKVMGKGRKK